MPKSSSTIVEPRLACRSGKREDPIECSLHVLPKQLLREFQHVFGDKYLRDGNGDAAMGLGSGGGVEVLAVPTNQHAKHDLVAVGDHIEAEKDRLLNCFMQFGEEVCGKVRAAGYWADYIDPCSGLPMLTSNCNKVYSEVDGMECLLNYRAYNAGFCKVLTHPKWGSAVYPATIFCHAPRDVVAGILRSLYL